MDEMSQGWSDREAVTQEGKQKVRTEDEGTDRKNQVEFRKETWEKVKQRKKEL